MKNREIISRLLDFVRYDNRMLRAATTIGWTNLADLSRDKSRFSALRLDFLNNSEQLLQLQNYFYHTFYVTGRCDLAPISESEPPVGPSLPLTQLGERRQLIDNAILKKVLYNGEVIAESGASRYLLRPGDYVRQICESDETVRIFNQNPRTNRAQGSAGWIYSDSIQPGFDFENQYIRFYFNPYPEQVIAIAHLLIQQLDAYEVPFQIKYLPPDLLVERCDRIVLYVPQRQFVVAAWAVMRVYDICKNHLQDRLPLFVRSLIRGVGFAEEPLSAESFGESRCGWIAFAIVQWTAGLPTDCSASPKVDELIDCILKQQEIEGLDQIHLNPGSFYPYNFEIFSSQSGTKFASKQPDIWLRGAIEIANLLCREAAWITPEKCLWIGATKEDNADIVYRALGEDWNQGCLGPILFLISLMKYVDDPLYKYFAERALPDLESILAKNSSCLALQNIYGYHSHLKEDGFRGPDEDRLTEESVTHIQGNKANCKSAKANFSYLKSVLKESYLQGVRPPAKFYDVLECIRKKSTAFETNELGTNDFTPGMTGLSLLGFSYLLAHDPSFPQVPLGNAYREFGLVQ